MAEKKGYISIHRKIQDSAIWLSDDKFDRRSAWIDLLLMANHEDREIMINGKMQTIHVGQRWTSIKQLSTRWHWSKDKTSTFLRTLESSGMVTTDRRTSGTLINIVNYKLYQHKFKDKSDTVSETKRKRNGNGTETDSSQTIMKNNEGIMMNKKGSEALGRILQ